VIPAHQLCRHPDDPEIVMPTMLPLTSAAAAERCRWLRPVPE
jgi:hypothetical protein